MEFKNARKKSSRPDPEEVISLLLRETSGDSDWLWETDDQRRIVNPSRKMRDFFESDTLSGKLLLEAAAGQCWHSGNFSTGLRDLADAFIKNERFQDLILPVVRSSGETWVEISGNPRFNSKGDLLGYLGVMSDITSARESANRLSKLARYDAATGLPNRQLTIDAIDSANFERMSNGTISAVAGIVIPGLATIKTELGVRKSELKVREIAETLRIFPNNNVFLSLIGPGEICVVFRDASQRDFDINKYLSSMIYIIQSSHKDADQFVKDISYGIEYFSDDLLTADHIINAAFERAYENSKLFRPKSHTPPASAGRELHSHRPDPHVKARAILEDAISAREGVRHLLSEMKWRLHNGGSDQNDLDNIAKLAELESALSDLISSAQSGTVPKNKIKLVRKLSSLVFSFCADTGHLMVAGLKPLAASAPIAFGTLMLLYQVCEPATASILAPGGALAVVAGYFSLNLKKD
ncbi:diguanylate cyclase [Sphingomonas sp. R647]|uniref:sensor domain-containing diguanylate cyclase n=1 Tax=Sphingomonas sp. R647 TaxID=2875233 RepID=UPI001CD4F6F0|nr:sensor domain-containing diguanylate cyclase [Sphingomonas sp. R647]MCA1199093.1 diguanylate cyclase [Sphingomonas sp. R647]